MDEKIKQIGSYKKEKNNVEYCIGWDGENVYYRKANVIEWYSAIKRTRTKDEALQIGRVYIEDNDI